MVAEAAALSQRSVGVVVGILLEAAEEPVVLAEVEGVLCPPYAHPERDRSS